MAQGSPADPDDRTALLARRLRAHALDASRPDLAKVELLPCGFQDAGAGTGATSLALRSGWEPVRIAIEDGALITAMTLRGAPHVHRRSDVALIRAAMTMTELRDLEVVCGPLPDDLAHREDPVGEVATAMDEVLDGLPPGEAMSKADLSTAVTPRLDAGLAPFCQPCGAHHAIDGLFRLATLRAWLEVVPGGRTQSFGRASSAPPAQPAQSGVSSARAELAAAAAHAAEPYDRAEVAAWLGWHPASVPSRIEAPSGHAGRSRPTRSARLLPSRDPWLRGSDRDWLLGANVARRQEVYRSLGAPGVVLSAGEIAGTWRQRKAGATLKVEISPWKQLTADERDEVEADAALVADSRGLRPQVQWQPA